MRFYVAGAAIEIERAERMIASLRSMGHSITFDWPAAMRAEPKFDHELSRDERVHYARADLAGVRQAECLIFLAPPGKDGAGCYVELGAALVLGIPVIVVRAEHEGQADRSRRSIFAELATYTVDGDREAMIASGALLPRGSGLEFT